MTCLADSVWKQVYVNGVNREDVRQVFAKDLTHTLLLWSNGQGRRRYDPSAVPDLGPIYQEHKAVIDSVISQAFDFADAIQRSIEGRR